MILRDKNFNSLLCGCLVVLISCLHNSEAQTIRLVGGQRSSQGRVEIYHNNTWGTICDDHFNNYAAKVVCKMLHIYNSRSYIVARPEAYFGQGTGPIWLDDVTCTGNENTLLNCRVKPWGRQNCRHTEDVGVDCNAALLTNIPIRLVNGSNSREGRVEVQYNGTWGTVCDDQFDDKAAKVICNSLGYTGLSVPLGNAYFGRGILPIMLDDLKCTGTEPNIAACNHKPWGTNNCHHSEDAGVFCLQGSSNPNIQIRLRGGVNQYQGRVEISVYGRWGTICDDSFDSREAAVVCRMLNFNHGGRVIRGRTFGGGSGPIWLDDLECRGNETSLATCVHKPYGVNNCGHDEDVGVACTPNTLPTVQVRLAAGPNSNEGRVEINYNGAWGTVCDDRWSNSDAAVICRMLHLPSSGAVGVVKSPYGPGTGQILLDDVVCVGTEKTIAACQSNGWGVNNCGHSEDAGVICQSIITTVPIRLSGGSGNWQGRLEVFYNNTWGTVCDDSFGMNEAQVVCRQLHFNSTGAIAKGSAYFGQGTGPILLDDMNCAGTERSLALCGHRGWGNNNCQHSEDVSVICSGSTPVNSRARIRLVGGTNGNEGRLEVNHNGAWGTVCDDYFDNVAAAVACKMLHKPWRGAQARGSAFFGAGTGQILLDNVVCRGNETNIAYCRHNTWGRSDCTHGEDVGVVCGQLQRVPIRLRNGTSTSNGRVEIFYNHTWGTVCDDSFDNHAASVVCHMLGFRRDNSVAISNANYGQGTGPILLDDVGCTGTEGNILQCRNKGWYQNNCDHSEDVSVVCNAARPSLRLIGTGSRNRGRVEIQIGSNWGTVCDDKFDNNAAKVVCRMLHKPSRNAVAVTAAGYGQGTGPIFLDDVRCFGNETSILSCRTNPIGTNDCDHSEDVGVICTNHNYVNVRVKLTGGPSSNEGRLQIYYANTWGSVCDDSFNDSAAMVICKMLNINAVQAHAVPGIRYNVSSTGPIWLDDVKCGGTESNIVNCQHSPFGTNDCDHTEDIGIICDTAQSLNVQVRIVNGSNGNTGRVEVNHNGVWGTVCDDGWGIPEATVLCRSLNKPTSVVVPLANAFYGSGSGPILMDDLDCAGNESSVSYCQHKAWGQSDCDHSEDAGVMCLARSPNPTISVRLVGGLSHSQGRVQIRYNNVWGSVCDDSWDNRDAAVICRMMGYSTVGARALTNIGTGSGPIWMDDVECTGSERSIANCTFKGWAEHNCDHTEDAGVYCHDGRIQNVTIRLANGPSAMEGRVEVRYRNQWGTVCDDLWSTADAKVVCRMLGYSTDGAIAKSRASYGQGTGTIFMDNVNCVGTEANIGQCTFQGWGINNCDHSEDAGVRCNIAGTVATSVRARLVHGSNSNEGRVELFYNNTWGTICDDYWDYRDAAVICHMLGKPTANAVAKQHAFFGRGTGPILLDDVNCFGNESVISQCGNRGFGVNNCGHGEDAGVICGGSTTVTPVRLVGGNDRYEGRLEVYHGGTWGTVCDDGANFNIASVVCRQLGFLGGTPSVRSNAFFGAGSGQMWMDDLRCSGTEASLDSCNFRQPWGSNNCDHSEDLGVVCRTPLLHIRLVDPNGNPNQGRVEVRVNGTWGTVCDDSFNNVAAGVVCSMLGYSRTGALAKPRAFFGRGTGQILLDDTHCTGTETNLIQCASKPLGVNDCSHSEDVGVICQVQTIPIRLVGGSSRMNGRVEVLYHNTWGTVCDDYFTTAAAQVVCRMLGFPYVGAYARSRAYFGRGTGQIWLDNVRCSGNESTLAQCNHLSWGSNNCGHGEDVGVVCTAVTTPHTTTVHTTRPPPSTPNPSQVFLRLVGGHTSYAGRVEVYASSVWGTICDDMWSSLDAGVVCRMFGYSNTGAVPKSRATYGQGVGKIWLDNVNCSGSESSIVSCHSNGWAVHNCGHQEDAGVVCSNSQIPNDFVLITDTVNRQIYRMDLTSQSYVIIPLSNHDNPISIDYDSSNYNIYWTDVGSKQIRRAGLDGRRENNVAQLGSTAVTDGVALDIPSQLIFYTDTGNDVIVVMAMDGSVSKVIINQGLDQPRAIVTDPLNGVIYWTDWGTNAKIEKANYDGTGRQQIINTGLGWPNGLAVDVPGNKLYWCDGKTYHIESANLDGSNRQVLLNEANRQPVPHYFGLALDHTTLYFTDWSRKTVMKINTDGTGLQAMGPPDFGRLNDIHVQKNGYGSAYIQNGCSNGKGGCSHLCLPRPGNSHICVCPSGLTLQQDGISCSRANPCKALRAPRNGQITPSTCTSQSSTSGTTCQVTCAAGYRLYGQSNVTCYSNGQWSNYGVLFRCRDVQAPTITCPAAMTVNTDKGTQTATVSWNKPTVSDNSGNTMLFQTMQSPVTLGKGSYTVTATAYDIAGQSATCSFTIKVNVQKCPPLQVPAYATVNYGCQNFYGSSCQLKCQQGYQLQGNPTIACDTGANGSPAWTTGTSCVEVTCPVPLAPGNGKIGGCSKPYTVGTLCSQACNNGYIPIGGTSNLQCQSSGVWAGQTLLCSRALNSGNSGGIYTGGGNTGGNNTAGGRTGAQRSSNTGGSSSKSTNSTGIVVGTVIGVVVLAVIVAAAFIYLKRMQYGLTGNNSDGGRSYEMSGISNPGYGSSAT